MSERGPSGEEERVEVTERTEEGGGRNRTRRRVRRRRVKRRRNTEVSQKRSRTPDQTLIMSTKSRFNHVIVNR